jgi:hypothetical protein
MESQVKINGQNNENEVEKNNYLTEINLKGTFLLIAFPLEIFTDDELIKFFKDEETDEHKIELEEQNRKRPSLKNSLKVNSFLFDRTEFMLKLLKICKEKLMGSKEKSLAKGLDW